MTYPSITTKNADLAGERLRTAAANERLGLVLSESDLVTQVAGFDYRREEIEELSASARDDWEELLRSLGPAIPTRQKLEAEARRLEGRMAKELHAALCDLPPLVLGDMGFWRYLAFFPYRWFLLAREPEVQPQDYGGTSEVAGEPDRRRSHGAKYQLILRTYLWGKAAFDPSEPADPYRRCLVVGETGGAEIDVWHSHVVRVQLGHLGRTTHHFIDSICADPKANTRDPARDVEKRLTRMKHTVLLDLYNGPDGRTLVDGQKLLALADLVPGSRA